MDTKPQPLTSTQLDEIAGRAAGLYEYATGLDDAWQDEADQLTGTDVPALLAEIRRLRDQLAATHTKVIATEADEIVAHCPDHGTRDGVWITCHCDVADDMRRRTLAV